MILKFYTVADFKDWVFNNDAKIYVNPDYECTKIRICENDFFRVYENLGTHFYDEFNCPRCIYADSESLEVILPNHLNVN